MALVRGKAATAYKNVNGKAGCNISNVFFSDACQQRHRQDIRDAPAARWPNPRHPAGDTHRSSRRAGHRVRLPSPDLRSQSLPYRGETVNVIYRAHTQYKCP